MKNTNLVSKVSRGKAGGAVDMSLFLMCQSTLGGYVELDLSKLMLFPCVSVDVLTIRKLKMWIKCCKEILKQLEGASNSMFVNCALHADSVSAKIVYKLLSRSAKHLCQQILNSVIKPIGS